MHIYKERNVCADRLANFGVTLFFSSLVLWLDLPEFFRIEYTRNRLGMLNFKFITFSKSPLPSPLFFLLLYDFYLYILCGAPCG